MDVQALIKLSRQVDVKGAKSIPPNNSGGNSKKSNENNNSNNKKHESNSGIAITSKEVAVKPSFIVKPTFHQRKVANMQVSHSSIVNSHKTFEFADENNSSKDEDEKRLQSSLIDNSDSDDDKEGEYDGGSKKRKNKRKKNKKMQSSVSHASGKEDKRSLNKNNSDSDDSDNDNSYGDHSNSSGDDNRPKKQRVLSIDSNNTFEDNDKSGNYSVNSAGNSVSNADESSNESSAVVYPYEVDDDDHCETPAEAYRHILPCLKQVAEKLGKSLSDLQVYDPYFCEGSARLRMNEVGLLNVYNKKEDFYNMIAAATVPNYDVLITNPPYSKDHINKLMEFVRVSKKPWFLLVPNYVYTKDYYEHAIRYIKNDVFYVAPQKRYMYTTPKGRRQQKSSKYTSPFPTFWYCSFSNDPMIKLKSIPIKEDYKNPDYVLARSPEQLPLVCLPDSDPRKRREKNRNRREKNKIRKKGK